MPSRFFKSSYATNEAGFYMLFVVGSLIALLTIVALGIDLGHLYRAKQVLQNACDAASIVSARLYVEPSSEYTNSQIENSIAPAIVRANMAEMNLIQPSSIQIETEGFGGPRPRQVRCRARMQNPTLLLRALPGQMDEVEVNSDATAINAQLFVTLVIDKSLSMVLPGTLPPGFIPPADCNPCNNKMDLAKYAAKRFVAGLKDFDRVSIVPFASWTSTATWDDDAIIALALTELDSSGRAQVENIIDAINGGTPPITNDLPPRAGVNTNIAAGIREGTSTLSSLGSQQFTRKMMVVLTDGAPALYPPLWNNPAHPSYPAGVTQAQLCTHLETEHVIENSAFYGPNDRRQGSSNADWNSERLRRYRFSETIYYADTARDSDIWIYTIGLGYRDAEDPTQIPNPAPSHYQHGVEVDTPLLGKPADFVKIPFMMRLANDQSGLADVANDNGYNIDAPTDPAGLSWDAFPCSRTSAELANEPQGKFYLAENTGELLAAFDSILAIRTQLIP